MNAKGIGRTGDNSTSEGATLSVLEQIQLAEVEVGRKVAAAREAGDLVIADAQKQVAELIKEAQEAGRQLGQQQLKESVEKAQTAGAELLARAHQQAEEIRRTGNARMDSLVSFAVNFVTGTDTERK